jgi:ribonuclease-3
MENNNSLIAEKLNYTFTNPSLLDEALTHSSYRHEAKEEGLRHNERLEFLGDQVLGLLVSQFLYAKMGEAEEGTLSHLRAHLVESASCAEYVQKLGICEFIKLGKGEARNQGRGRETLFADLFEAILGAIFLDGGFDAAFLFFEDKVVPLLDEKLKNPPFNFKAALQTFVQKEYKTHPQYKVLEESGPEHSKIFKVGVYVQDKMLGLGEGGSKKLAEMQAAKNALQAFKAE